MSVTLGSNIAALGAIGRVGENTRAVTESYERLSSGLRINRAKDDAAGLSIASSLNSDTQVYGQAIRNLNDAVSSLSIAETGLIALSDITIRQRELAEQAANGTLSNKQRRSLQSEADALVNEFNRIVNITQFNGRNLLDGSFQGVKIQAGYGTHEALTADIGNSLQRYVAAGTFTTTQTISWLGNPAGNLIDTNGDGRADLVETGLNVRLGQADGTFSSTTISSGGAGGGYNLTNGDFNGDGLQDIVAFDPYNSAYPLSIRLSAGNGTFTVAQTFNMPSGGFTFAIAADADGDGKDDLAFINNSTYALNFFHANGNGTFTAVQSLATGVGPYGMAVADFNNDGRKDIAVSFADISDNRVGIYYGQSNGTLSSMTIAATGGMTNLANPFGMFTGDFNRDGNADFGVANTVGNFSIILGNGDGTFSVGLSVTNTLGGGYSTVTQGVVDFNGDGYDDIIGSGTLGGNTRLFVQYGNGNGTFRAAATLATDTANGYCYGDINGDGVLDVVGNTYGVSHYVYISDTQRQSTIGKLYLLTQQGARDALTTLSNTLTRISGEMGKLGAIQSRIDVAKNVVMTQREQFQTSAAQITDVDVASEAAELARRNILQQASASVLSQANLQPQLALTLLRG